MSKLISVKSFLFALILVFSVSAPNARAADTGFAIAGHALVASNFTYTFLSFGGPALKVTSGDVTAGLSFYPSLKLAKSPVQPILGVGPYVDYDHFVIAAPFYYVEGQMKVTGGLGYRF
jgi:hypothetical protein